jgi:hypothetical protein
MGLLIVQKGSFELLFGEREDHALPLEVVC